MCAAAHVGGHPACQGLSFTRDGVDSSRQPTRKVCRQPHEVTYRNVRSLKDVSYSGMQRAASKSAVDQINGPRALR
jgi:hypothetical protein